MDRLVKYKLTKINESNYSSLNGPKIEKFGLSKERVHLNPTNLIYMSLLKKDD